MALRVAARWPTATIDTATAPRFRAGTEGMAEEQETNARGNGDADEEGARRPGHQAEHHQRNHVRGAVEVIAVRGTAMRGTAREQLYDLSALDIPVAEAVRAC